MCNPQGCCLLLRVLPPCTFLQTCILACAVSCRHLKDLLADQARCEALTKEDLGLYIDFSRQRATQDTIKVRQSSSCWLVYSDLQWITTAW
jgi:hypothetical protein